MKEFLERVFAGVMIGGGLAVNYLCFKVAFPEVELRDMTSLQLVGCGLYLVWAWWWAWSLTRRTTKPS